MTGTLDEVLDVVLVLVTLCVLVAGAVSVVRGRRQARRDRQLARDVEDLQAEVRRLNLLHLLNAGVITPEQLGLEAPTSTPYNVPTIVSAPQWDAGASFKVPAGGMKSCGHPVEGPPCTCPSVNFDTRTGDA